MADTDTIGRQAAMKKTFYMFVVFLFMWCGCVNAEYNAFINQSGKAGEKAVGY